MQLKFQQERAYLHGSELNNQSLTINRAAFYQSGTIFSFPNNLPVEFLHLWLLLICRKVSLGQFFNLHIGTTLFTRLVSDFFCYKNIFATQSSLILKPGLQEKNYLQFSSRTPFSDQLLLAPNIEGPQQPADPMKINRYLWFIIIKKEQQYVTVLTKLLIYLEKMGQAE